MIEWCTIVTLLTLTERRVVDLHTAAVATHHHTPITCWQYDKMRGRKKIR
jgi:hypothetical protein